MAESEDMEGLLAQIEELRERLELVGIAGSPRGQSKDVSLVAGIREWTGESKGKPVQEFLTQVESLAKVSRMGFSHVAERDNVEVDVKCKCNRLY
jgi:hypothetical protein